MSNINPYIHDFTVDLRNGVTMERAKKPLSQGDAFANKIVAHVLKDGQTVPLDGVAVSASVIRYDGATVPLTGTVEEGAACIVLNDECYAVPGDLLVSVVLAVGEVKQTILRLMLNVETSQTDIIADGGVIGSFSQLLAEIENMRSATAAAISAAERAEAAADKAEGIAPGGGGTGTVTSVNGVEPDEEGNVQITIPEVPAWAMAATKPTYTAKEVGADPAGTAASKVSTHNADEDAHPAIRQLVSDLSGRLNALADSDDTTLDQLSEIVAYIKSNKSLIDSITTGKVSVADIVDNLTSTATNKPLSAAQGKALKALIDAIVVPTKVSAFENDAGYAKQKELAELAEEIADLKENAGSVGGTTIPDYVRTAAEEVAEKIISINGAAKGGASGSAGYTNQLPISTDGAGAVYNGTGWKENTRISSSGTIKDGVGANLTGYMPAKPGDVLRMQGITLGKNGVPSGYTGSFLWCFDGSYTRLGSLTRGDENGDGVFLPTESDDGILTYTIPSTYACTYIRLQVRTISDTSIITINEEINEDSGGATSGADAVPVTFAVLSDLHWNDADAPRHRSARQSMEVVSETAPVDAALFLGDLIPNWTWMSYEDAVVDISNCRKAYANLPMPSLWLRGNHDNNAYPDERISKAEIYTRIARRQHNVWVSNSADPYGCYGYMDFDASKVRIICVNTSDNDQFYPKTPPNAESIGGLLGAINVTATQLQWIADVALDFSDKTDPAAWGIVVASHIPISLYPDTTYTGDDGVTWECKIQTVSALINAYVNGTTFSATVNEETANADFSSVENRAEMICFVSGHKHAMLSGTINGFLDVVCPNVSSAGEKVSTDGNTYAKTAIGTVGETAVSFITIDRANRKIYANVYGSGYDREFDY